MFYSIQQCFKLKFTKAKTHPILVCHFTVVFSHAQNKTLKRPFSNACSDELYPTNFTMLLHGKVCEIEFITRCDVAVNKQIVRAGRKKM